MSFRVYEEANDVKYATTRSRGQIRKTYHVDPPGSQKPGDHFRRSSAYVLFTIRRDTDMKPYFSFQWHITDECDQRCKHCYIYSAGNHTCLQSMNWKQMEDTFYNCLDFCEMYGRTPYFYITGASCIV